MPPRWTRRAVFYAFVAWAAVLVASVGNPEACTSVWTWEHKVHRCCQLASQTRWTRAGGDCCDYGFVEDRDPSATASALLVPPSAYVRVAIASRVAPAPVQRWLRADALIPERPPDRARATDVLLI